MNLWLFFYSWCGHSPQYLSSNSCVGTTWFSRSLKSERHPIAARNLFTSEWWLSSTVRFWKQLCTSYVTNIRDYSLSSVDCVGHFLLRHKSSVIVDSLNTRISVYNIQQVARYEITSSSTRRALTQVKVYKYRRSGRQTQTDQQSPSTSPCTTSKRLAPSIRNFGSPLFMMSYTKQYNACTNTVHKRTIH